MDDLISYYATQKEKLTLTMHKDLITTQQHSHNTSSIECNIKHSNIAVTEDEAKSRIFFSLVEDVGKKCNEYLQLTHNSIHDDITFMFGSDGAKGCVLHELYEKLFAYQETGVTNTTDITKSSKHVINLDFQEHCVRCSGLASRYNSGMMKKLADYQRSKYSRKSHLSFTTRHMGRCVQVVVTMPCPLCQTAEEKSSEAVIPDIKTVPCIEKEYIQKNSDDQLLLENPISFIEQALWRWVDDHHG